MDAWPKQRTIIFGKIFPQLTALNSKHPQTSGTEIQRQSFKNLYSIGATRQKEIGGAIKTPTDGKNLRKVQYAI